MARPLHEPHCLDQARTLRMKCLRMIGFALAASVAAGQANAEELTGTLKKIKETGTINIGYRDSSIPFSYLDDNQKPIGFAIDICIRIVDAVKKELKLAKLAVELQRLPSPTPTFCPQPASSPRSPVTSTRSTISRASRWPRRPALPTSGN